MYAQTMEYYSVLKNELSSHRKTWRNCKYVLLSEKKSIWKSYRPYNSNYMMFWKRQNRGINKMSGFQEIMGQRAMTRQSTEDF